MTVTEARLLDLQSLAVRLQIPINDYDLFDRALTHSSTAADAGGPARDYEALEFLGDAVLGLAVSHYLLETSPDRTPGEYSRIRAVVVNRRCVARVGHTLDIAPVIRLGKGEESSGGRERLSLIADCLEALIGAIYLDSGWPVAQEFVVRAFTPELERTHELDRVWDFKSRLQNHCQAERISLPEFVVVRSEGPDHQKEFEVEVLLDGAPMGRGSGTTKKEAEQHAAREALERMGKHFG